MGLAILKFLVILVLILCGAFFVFIGRGGTIGTIRYKGVEGSNVPVGIAFVAAAVLLAVFWEVSGTNCQGLSCIDFHIERRNREVFG